ncbi:MAG TPA: GNAT family N-acetyltransferase [Acidimicrobiales bacterium]|jgi:predicted acetyltransferase|nr:GNAT family N-acetyltransferase [Acidimicrobiales bacterium]
MDADIRPIGAGEVRTFVRVGAASFHGNPTAEQVGRDVADLPGLDRTLGAFVGGSMVATAGSYALELTLPGGSVVPLSALSWVGVVATHRRRGLLSALMRAHLDDARARGEAVAGLFASEGGIYGRFGYGPATVSRTYRLDRDRSALALVPDAAGSVELVAEEVAGKELPRVHDRARRGRAGDVSAAPGWWGRTMRSDERDPHGGGGTLVALHRGIDGSIDGGVVYRVPEDGTGPGCRTVQVDHLVAENQSAYAGLWALLLDLDLTTTVVATRRPVDEPLRWMLSDPRQLQATAARDGLWVRLVDLTGALAARRYAAEGVVVLEVMDRFCPWNRGRWRLEGGPEGGECRRARAGDKVDLALDVATLGALYLGGHGVAPLVHAGRLAEESPGAARRLGAMLAADPAPWCSTEF